jgi:hypothetical protein
VRLDADEGDPAEDAPAGARQRSSYQPSAEATVLGEIGTAGLRRLISRAPISGRSRRAVLGRYLDDLPDELLAQAESELAGQAVLPSHVQVRRAKDLARLRVYAPLLAFLGIAARQGDIEETCANDGTS